MRKLGHVLMWFGFLGAAFFGMRQLDTVEWLPFGAFAVVGAVGVLMLRITARAGATDVEVVSEDLATLERSLARVNETVHDMLDRRDQIHVYDVRHLIDEKLTEPLEHFADARESMIHGIGMHQYAAVMDPFARGERLVHRAWSASADGYIDEVWASMEAASTQLDKADATLVQYLREVRGTS